MRQADSEVSASGSNFEPRTPVPVLLRAIHPQQLAVSYSSCRIRLSSLCSWSISTSDPPEEISNDTDRVETI